MCDFNPKDLVEKDIIIQEQESLAHSLKLKLFSLQNRREYAIKRWFWELLQNASDYNDSVSVRLTVTLDKVIFQHNGNPFRTKDVLNIISPNSNKEQSDSCAIQDGTRKDNIGKFGTGLVSTHILSAILEVEGQCNVENHNFHFSIIIDRTKSDDQNALINQRTSAKKAFMDSLKEVPYESGFQTSFTYYLGHPLQELPATQANDLDLDYLYDVLPYTLCFLPKVKSVSIYDQRNGESEYTISRHEQTDRQITLCVCENGNSTLLHFAYFVYNDVSTVFRYEENTILPFPESISRLFCGLPLIGTESIGLPLLLNSLKFQPTTEREGVEIDPNVKANEGNRKLFQDAIELYNQVLSFIEENKVRGAFVLSHLRKKYNGSDASNNQFVSNYFNDYKKVILSHKIVPTQTNDFISFNDVILPFKDSKPDHCLYEIVSFISPSNLPSQKDFEYWFDAIDFVTFKEQGYTYKSLVQKIEQYGSIGRFGKKREDVIEWLLRCVSYLKDCDNYIFSNHHLLPNQEGELCTANSLNVDGNLPQNLKKIYNELVEEDEQKIESELLENGFEYFQVVNQILRLEDLCRRIDSRIAAIYSKKQGDTKEISNLLNRLYGWLSTADETKENLSNWFHWFYPKRATLIVDMLDETEREQALLIAKSGKMKVLSEIADMNITAKDMELILHNKERLPNIISLLNDVVDDTIFADSEHGRKGEEIVWDLLRQKYPGRSGYKVVWASRDYNEPRYDFEIQKGGEPICYYDAKTTLRGIGNSDSIPFFMRKSQWEFLQSLDKPYYIARVFLGDGGIVKCLEIAYNKE